MDTSGVTIAATAVGAAFTTFLGWLAGRRKTSGRIAVSDADKLWDEAKDIRDMLLANAHKAEEQRDQLFELQQTEISTFMHQTLNALTALETKLAEVLDAIQKTRNAETRPPPGEEGR